MIKDFLQKHGEYHEDKYFKELTTLKMGGHITHFVMPETIEDLQEIISYLRNNSILFKIIGNGSNLVCGSSEYDGVVISLKKLDTYEISNDEIYAQAGVMVPMLASVLAGRGLSCLEFASGIPGCIGGLVYMNAGAYKGCMADVIEEVQVIANDELVWMKKEDVHFAYRRSIFQQHPHWAITAVKLKVQSKDPEQIQSLMADRLSRRRQTQPLDKPSAGSCFRNPEEQFAWKLIDGIGYRGFTINGVSASEKHPNFIVNNGDGCAEDYLNIVYQIQDKVKEKYGISLVMEVEKFNC